MQSSARGISSSSQDYASGTRLYQVIKEFGSILIFSYMMYKLNNDLFIVENAKLMRDKYHKYHIINQGWYRMSLLVFNSVTWKEI